MVRAVPSSEVVCSSPVFMLRIQTIQNVARALTLGDVGALEDALENAVALRLQDMFPDKARHNIPPTESVEGIEGAVEVSFSDPSKLIFQVVNSIALRLESVEYFKPRSLVLEIVENRVRWSITGGRK